MKICDITQFYSPVGGGVRRYITEKRKFIESQTSHEHMLVIPGARTEMFHDGRLTLCTVASPPINRTSRYRILFNVRQAEDFIRSQKPDIIEVGDPYHVAWRMSTIADEMQIPVVGFYHSHFPEAYLRTLFKYCGRWLRDLGMAYAEDYIARLYSSFDATLVPSSFLCEVLKEYGVMNTAHFHLGINTALFYPAKPTRVSRVALGLPEGKILLLYIGRLAGEKNTAVLMETFYLLNEKYPGQFAFLVVGDGQLRNTVRAASGDIPDFRWISYCDDQEMLADYYRLADLFVHPGVCETFGLVSLESQACGRPVVGIRGSYMDANILAGLELWAHRNTPEDLADSISRFTFADRTTIGAEASRKVLELFSWNTVFDKMFSFYEGLIAGKKRVLEV